MRTNSFPRAPSAARFLPEWLGSSPTRASPGWAAHRSRAAPLICTTFPRAAPARVKRGAVDFEPTETQIVATKTARSTKSCRARANEAPPDRGSMARRQRLLGDFIAPPKLRPLSFPRWPTPRRIPAAEQLRRSLGPLFVDDPRRRYKRSPRRPRSGPTPRDPRICCFDQQRSTRQDIRHFGLPTSYTHFTTRSGAIRPARAPASQGPLDSRATRSAPR